jgi:hypothetical protein
MGYTLERFSNECHHILSEDPGVGGRKKVRDYALFSANKAWYKIGTQGCFLRV